MSFFLIEIDPLTQKETLRKDASSFLKKFVESLDFRRWYQQEVKERIDTLQTNLTLLDELCEKVCKEVNLPRSSTSASFFKVNSKINEETELTFSSSSSQKRKCEEEETKYAKLQKK